MTTKRPSVFAKVMAGQAWSSHTSLFFEKGLGRGGRGFLHNGKVADAFFFFKIS